MSNAEISDAIAPRVNPYNFQSHLYDKSRPENVAFLGRLRGVMDEFDSITSVGEVGEDQRGLELQAEYTEGTERLHMCYGFDFLSRPFPSGTRVAEVLERFQRIASDSWACWAFSNHDVERHTSRWSLSDDAHKAYLALLLSLRGSICLYQGEELGLSEADVAFEDLQDPYGIRFWPWFKGRDGCRTPMAWVSGGTHGGFSEGKPWLPVDAKHQAQAVDSQENEPNSVLNFYRAMIAFRKSHSALIKGAFEVVEADDTFISFKRTFGGTTLFCAFNLSDGAHEVTMPEGTWKIDIAAPFDVAGSDTNPSLPPWHALFAKMT